MSVNHSENSVTTGRYAEQLACNYLRKQGLDFITNNYRIKNGEIDLIMRDDTHLVFVEVKMRTKNSHGQATEMISNNKKQLIIRTAKQYLQANDLTERMYARFDVVGINASNNEIIWIKNAFEVQY